MQCNQCTESAVVPKSDTPQLNIDERGTCKLVKLLKMETHYKMDFLPGNMLLFQAIFANPPCHGLLHGNSNLQKSFISDNMR